MARNSKPPAAQIDSGGRVSPEEADARLRVAVALCQHQSTMAVQRTDEFNAAVAKIARGCYHDTGPKSESKEDTPSPTEGAGTPTGGGSLLD